MAFDAIISPSKLSGKVSVPPSKSHLHRALFASSLSSETSRIRGFATSDDIESTIRVIRAAGASLSIENDEIDVKGPWRIDGRRLDIDIGDSATSLRLALPLLAGADAVSFTLGESLSKRPFSDYRMVFGEALSLEGTTLHFSGDLEAGHFTFDNPTSSQPLSGLLFALPLHERASKIRVDRLGSRPYVDMTIAILRKHGITIDESDETFEIPGRQAYRPADIVIEGDASHAALWLAAGTVHPAIRVAGFRENGLQGDARIVPMLRRIGGEVFTDDGCLGAKMPKTSFTVDIDATPDLAFAYALMMAFCESDSRLVNAERLAYKESDRLRTIAAVINRLGGAAATNGNRLIISGRDAYAGGADIDAENDHRIVMFATLLGGLCERPVRIRGAHAVRKSYPRFFEDFAALGGQVETVPR